MIHEYVLNNIYFQQNSVTAISMAHFEDIGGCFEVRSQGRISLSGDLEWPFRFTDQRPSFSF